MPEQETSSAIPALEGKTVIDDKLFFEPGRLSYESADQIALEIVQRIRAKIRDKPVVVADLDLLAAFSNVVATGMVLDSLERTYQALSELAQDLRKGRRAPKKAPAPQAAAGLAAALALPVVPVATVVTGIQAALGVLSLFREDVELRGAPTTLDPTTFALALAAQLRDHAQSVLVPDLFALPPSAASSSSLQVSLQSVQTAQQNAWQGVGPWIAQLSRLNAELDLAMSREDQEAVDALSSQVAALRRDLDPVTEALDRADQALAQLQAEWQKPDPKSGLTGLARLLRAEAIRARNPYIVHAQVVLSGGHHRIARSLWRTLFQGDGLSAMGGAVARWALLDPEGGLLDGGILAARQAEDFPKFRSRSSSWLPVKSAGATAQPVPLVEKPPAAADAPLEER